MLISTRLPPERHVERHAELQDSSTTSAVPIAPCFYNDNTVNWFKAPGVFASSPDVAPEDNPWRHLRHDQRVDAVTRRDQQVATAATNNLKLGQAIDRAEDHVDASPTTPTSPSTVPPASNEQTHLPASFPKGFNLLNFDLPPPSANDAQPQTRPSVIFIHWDSSQLDVSHAKLTMTALRPWMHRAVYEHTKLRPEHYDFHPVSIHCSATKRHCDLPKPKSSPALTFQNLLDNNAHLLKTADFIFTVGIRGLGFNLGGWLNDFLCHLPSHARIFSTLDGDFKRALHVTPKELMKAAQELLENEGLMKDGRIEVEDLSNEQKVTFLLRMILKYNSDEFSVNNVGSATHIASQAWLGYSTRLMDSFTASTRHASKHSRRFPQLLERDAELSEGQPRTSYLVVKGAKQAGPVGNTSKTPASHAATPLAPGTDTSCNLQTAQKKSDPLRSGLSITNASKAETLCKSAGCKNAIFNGISGFCGYHYSLLKKSEIGAEGKMCACGRGVITNKAQQLCTTCDSGKTKAKIRQTLNNARWLDQQVVEADCAGFDYDRKTHRRIPRASTSGSKVNPNKSSIDKKTKTTMSSIDKKTKSTVSKSTSKSATPRTGVKPAATGLAHPLIANLASKDKSKGVKVSSSALAQPNVFTKTTVQAPLPTTSSVTPARRVSENVAQIPKRRKLPKILESSEAEENGH
ncbi:hypothetical protein OIO90_002903 [Microbotryomycetes sp. JL221]|nr:hypothetical protein OIO90_002903 [Microbotryomycetes sp. JL221]